MEPYVPFLLGGITGFVILLGALVVPRSNESQRRRH